MVDSNNNTRWKHRWGWHNLGCVWDKIASEWVGAEEWSDKRRRCQDAVSKRDIVTFAMVNVKHTVGHRPQSGESIKQNKGRKEPRKRGPPDLSVDPRTDGATVQMCENINVAEK